MGTFREIFLDAIKGMKIELNEEQIRKFELYYDLLRKRSKDFNLVASASEEDIVWKHFIDSIALPKEIIETFFAGNKKLLDIGTGAGFPGIPLKIVLPALQVFLLEATAKKVEFLEESLEALSLPDIHILLGRAEELARDQEYRESFEIVVGRALAELPTFAELSLPFVATGGICLAYKGPNVDEELKIGRKALEVMGGSIIGLFRYSIKDFKRTLVVIEKRRNTPKEYPRRPGMPKKRPLL